MKTINLFLMKLKHYFLKLFLNRSIQKKLFLSSVLLMLTVVVTFSVLSYNIVANIFVKKQIDYYKSSLKLSSEYFNNNFIDIEDGIKKLYNSSIINKYISEHVNNTNFNEINTALSSINTEFNKVFLPQNYINDIVLLGANNMSYIYAMGKQSWYVGEDFNFNHFSEDNLLLSDDKSEGIPFYYKYNGKNSSSNTENQIHNQINNNIIYLRKLRNENNAVIGIIIITFKPTIITDLFSNLGQDSKLYLINKNNNQVLLNSSTVKNLKYHTFSHTEQGDVFYCFREISKTKSLLTYYNLTPNNLEIIIKTPTSQIYPNSFNTMFYLILYGFFCMTFVIIASYFLSKRLSIPLINLANTLTKDMSIKPEEIKPEHLFPLQNYGLRAKFIAYFSLTVIIPLILFCASLTYNYYKLYYNKVTQLTISTIDQVKRYIDYNFNNYNYITSQFVYSDYIQHSWPKSDNDRFIERDSSVIRDMFSDMRRSKSEFFSMNLYNVNGNNIYSDIYLDTFPASNITKNFINIINNSIGELKFLGVQKNYYKNSVLVFARKIRSLQYVNRPTVGYAVFFVEQSYVDNIYQTLDSDISKNIVLMDGDYNIITSNYKDSIASVIRSSSYSSKSEKYSQSPTLSFETEKYLIVQNNSENFAYKVVSVIPITEIGAMILPLLLYILYILLAYFIVILLITSFLASSIIKPLKKLLSLMKKDSIEELMNYKGKDEIAIISQQFNRLILENYQSKLNESQLLYLEKEAVLTSLQQQINPHFLYNTLEIIKWMAYKKGAEDICNMVTALGNFFRGSISTGKQLITFEEEIEHLKSYIYIYEIRCGGRSEIHLNIDKDLNQCKTLKLILQPLVENSIKHGIESIRHKGIITIVGYIKDEMVNIEISDNGIGMSETQLKTLKDSLKQEPSIDNKQGIGLLNVYKRIKLYFKEQAIFLINSEKDMGTSIKISFPVIK